MSSAKKVVIFDTNGLNKILDDGEQANMLCCLEKHFSVRISEINVVEVAATRDAVRREKLLDLLQTLVPLGGCMLPPHEIITEMARCHARYKDRFKWLDVDVRDRQLEKEIRVRTFLKTAQSAVENLRWLRSTGKQFEKIFKEAVERFPLENAIEDRLSPTRIIEIVKAEGGPFWCHVASLYQRGNLIPLPISEAKSFIQRCPPFHALAMISSIGQFNAQPVRPGERRLPEAGRADLLMATYLPYCDFFISDDPGVQKDFRVIIDEVRLPVDVISYEELKNRCASLA